MKKPTLTVFRRALHYLSAEWILVDWDVPNGGAVVLVRSLFSGTVLFILMLGFINIADPNRSWAFSSHELRVQLIHYLPWYGVIFAGIYTALYTKFASQWKYLAELYNSIKEVEALGVKNESAMADWKAGFIEDAQTLHMECKGSFVAIIQSWLEDPSIKRAFKSNTVAGKIRLKDLERSLKFSRMIVRKSYVRAHKRNLSKK